MLLTPQAEKIIGAPTPARSKFETSAMLALGAALLALAVLYFPTFASIMRIWNTSDTFAHGYIILPISVWLIWRRRAQLAALPPRPLWPTLALLLVAGFGWLLASLGGVQVVMQYAVVMMIPLIVLLIGGPRLTWAMAFPLAFLLLAVPFGEVFIDPLIAFTADFTVRALQITGIPVLRNGTRFEIPSGSWSVVEACSGVRYLISSVTLGCLYAYLTFRSHARQALFVLLSIVVPIIANGLRAYMIVMIGHLSGMTLAVGFDHIIYGWVFFGLVMFLMFWIGSYWREDDDLGAPAVKTFDGSAAGQRAQAAQVPRAPGLWPASIAAIVCIGVWPLYSQVIDRLQGTVPAPQLAPITSTWQPGTPFTPWKPFFAEASATRLDFFQQGAERVGLSLLYYRNQHAGTALITSTNRLVSSNDALHTIGESSRNETVAGRALALKEAIIDGPQGSIMVWHWYWIDGRFTASDYVGKLLQAKGKLLLQGDDGASVMLVTPLTGTQDASRTTLRNFLNTNLAPVQSVLVQSHRR